MAGITQSIPNYYGGISEQPDQLKNPGQVKEALNAIPDLTHGLYKRPGTKRIGTLADVQEKGSWFHYYRDEGEGSYIGQIDKDGIPRVWRCKDGAAMTIAYSSGHGGTQSNLRSYLTPSSINNTEDLQFLTINDNTFVVNRTKAVTLTASKTETKPHAHAAYVEILRTENGRQYGLNINDGTATETAVKFATRVNIDSTNLSTDWGTGNCPGIGTQVFGHTETFASRSGPGSSAKNFTFRITTLGQTGDRQGDDDGDSDSNSYRCAYSTSVDLLHGGYDWETGDHTTVTLTQASTDYTYTVKVKDHETTHIKGTINGGVNGIIRPTPTPWDAQTAVSTDTILGGIVTETGPTGLQTQIIGNGIYIYSSSQAFNVEVCEPDLMRVMQSEINDVSKLPTQCKHGYIVKVTNSQQSDEDDYYLKFVGEYNKSGPGSWVECPAPDIHDELDHGTMPVTIARTADTTFTVSRYDWDKRLVGDETTNPIPTFVSRKTAYGHTSDEDRYINKVLFFRNRLALLSGPNIITTQPGDFGNFWVNTALTVSGIDPIDISTSSTLPSALYDGLEMNAGLLVFTSNSQHLLASDDTVFNPDTAKFKTISSYNYDKTIPPISLGTTIGFIDNSNKFSRFNELASVNREGQAIVIDQTKVVPSLIPKDVDLICNSRENGYVFFSKTDSTEVIGFKYVTIGDQRLQSAWFKWKFKNGVRYHFVENDRYYLLSSDNWLQSLEFVQADTDPSIDEEGTNFQIHIDNWTTVANGTFDAATNKTTFTDQSDWIDLVTNGNTDLVLVDTNADADRVGRYASCTVINNDDFTVPGNWSGDTVHIGYLYDYQVDFPRIYTTKVVGQQTVADLTASLVLHRINLSLGKVGLYETTLTRVGKQSYTDIYESTLLNNYNVSDAPYLDEKLKTIPIYDKNKNVDITLKSTHPSPCTLRSMSWEGDYSPMYYKRA